MITVFKIFIRGGMLSDIQLEIFFLRLRNKTDPGNYQWCSLDPYVFRMSKFLESDCVGKV